MWTTILAFGVLPYCFFTHTHTHTKRYKHGRTGISAIGFSKCEDCGCYRRHRVVDTHYVFGCRLGRHADRKANLCRAVKRRRVTISRGAKMSRHHKQTR